jgi:hypothetical protein
MLLFDVFLTRRAKWRAGIIFQSQHGDGCTTLAAHAERAVWFRKDF